MRGRQWDRGSKEEEEEEEHARLEEEDGEREEHRDARGDLLARLDLNSEQCTRLDSELVYVYGIGAHGQVEDEDGEEGDAGAGHDEVHEVEEWLAPEHELER